MRRTLHGIILLVIVAFPSSSPLVSAEQSRVRSIAFEGNHAFTDRQLLDRMVLQQHTLYLSAQLSSDVASIERYYHQHGYYFASVGPRVEFSDDSSWATVTIDIEEGEQVRVGTIEIVGNALLTADQILAGFDTQVGAFLDPPILEHDIDRLLSRYARMGRPFATISVDRIILADNSIYLTITLRIDEGAPVTIEEIQITGNASTHANVILRELGIRLHESYDREKVERIPQRLNRLSIFSRVHEPELYVSEKGGGLLIRVEEANANSFDGVLGYAPAPSEGEQGSVTGMVNVAMRNLFGTGRKMQVRWQRDDRSSHEIDFQYVEPWVLDAPVNLAGSFFQRQQDSTYVSRTLFLGADVRATDVWMVGAFVRRQETIPSSTLTQQFIADSRTISTGLSLAYDSRNDHFAPTGGVRYRSEYQIGSKRSHFTSSITSFIPERSTIRRLSLDAETYIETVPRQILAVGLHGRQVTSDGIEVSDHYRFGGTNTIRGYRENQFSGSRIAWTNTEYRFLLARRSFVYGFFDTGYYFLPDDPIRAVSSLQRVTYGYGVGVRLETALGNMGVSFAFGRGDSFGQGKIHIGLVNEF
jgi:outer membrane protein insertion porin family